MNDRNLFGEESSVTYTRYMRSPEWRKKAREALARAEDRCHRCGCSKHVRRLEVHHLTYERLGRERPEDLEVVCKDCHVKADEERAVASRTRARNALWNARLDGWATKRWGEDWEQWPGYETADEAFNEWLEAQE